jgi:gas vesicle protein
LAGQASGVAIGILIAPGKGSETWKKIKDGLEDLRDQALDQVNDVVAKGKDLVGKGND